MTEQNCVVCGKKFDQNSGIVDDGICYCSSGCMMEALTKPKTPAAKPEEPKKQEVQPEVVKKPEVKETIPVSSGNLCDMCKKQEGMIDQEGKKYCMGCIGKLDKEENPLLDKAFANFVTFKPTKDLEEDEEHKVGEKADSYYSTGYLHINKQQTDQVEYLGLVSNVSQKMTLPQYFASVAAYSPYQFLITGGGYLNQDSNIVGLNSFIAVSVSKDKQYFSFSNLPDMAARRHGHASIIFNKQLYVFGGIQRNSADSTYTWVDSCAKFNLEGIESTLNCLLVPENEDVPLGKDNKWTAVKSMKKGRANAGVFVSKEHIYIFGGFSGPGVPEHSIEKYDPKTDKWETVDLSAKLDKINYKFLASSVVLNSDKHAYVIGGSDGKNESNQVIKIHKETLEPEALKPLNKRRANALGFEAGGNLYVFGGELGDLTIEKMSVKDDFQGFKVSKPIQGIDDGSGIFGKGFVGDFGFYLAS